MLRLFGKRSNRPASPPRAVPSGRTPNRGLPRSALRSAFLRDLVRLKGILPKPREEGDGGLDQNDRRKERGRAARRAVRADGGSRLRKGGQHHADPLSSPGGYADSLGPL